MTHDVQSRICYRCGGSGAVLKGYTDIQPCPACFGKGYLDMIVVQPGPEKVRPVVCNLEMFFQ